MNHLRVHWKAIALLLLIAVGLVTAVSLLSSPAGRYCDDSIGATGHPYWSFSSGEVQIVACSEHIHQGSYYRSGNDWVWVSDYQAEKFGPQTNLIEVHLSGISIIHGDDREERRRCWHFWMNSEGPLWHSWCK